MNEKDIKAIEMEIQSLMQLRGSLAAFIGLTAGGIIGLILSEFNFLKLLFIILGLLMLYFLFTAVKIIGGDIEHKIKELKQ